MVNFQMTNWAFLRLRSTVTCLLKNTDDWYNELDLGKLVGLVFIDLKQAFDTVDHEILCEKLEIYGIQHRELSWFKSYLANRKQFCQVGGVDSEIREVEVGVPQGSCFGPLLFLIYINDLPLAVQDSTVSMYADDTSLCHQSHNLTQLNEAIMSRSVPTLTIPPGIPGVNKILVHKCPGARKIFPDECPGAGKMLLDKCPEARNFFCANACGCPGGGIVRAGIE